MADHKEVMIVRPVEKIKAYFQRAERYPIPRFILEMTAMSFVLQIICTIILVIVLFVSIIIFVTIFQVSPDDLPKDWGLEEPNTFFDRYIVACIIAPMVETVVGQWLPIWFVSKFTKRMPILIAMSTLFFLVFHHPARYMAALGAGPILAFSFIVQRRVSRKRAYWVTTIIHALHNTIVTLF